MWQVTSDTCPLDVTHNIFFVCVKFRIFLVLVILSAHIEVFVKFEFFCSPTQLALCKELCVKVCCNLLKQHLQICCTYRISCCGEISFHLIHNSVKLHVGGFAFIFFEILPECAFLISWTSGVTALPVYTLFATLPSCWLHRVSQVHVELGLRLGMTHFSWSL